jgi:MFS family permease
MLETLVMFSNVQPQLQPQLDPRDRYRFHSPVAGHIADRFGKRRTILFSLLVWSLSRNSKKKTAPSRTPARA